MHTSFLAFEASTFCSVMSLIFGSLPLLTYYSGYRNWRLLPIGFGWYGVCVYFAMLAISAGDAPMISRTEMVIPLRMLSIVSFSAMAVGKFSMFVHLWNFLGTVQPREAN